MSDFEWKEHNTLSYLYRGDKFCGALRRLPNGGYDVYVPAPVSDPQMNRLVSTMPTLDEAKGLLLTLAGAQL